MPPPQKFLSASSNYILQWTSPVTALYLSLTFILIVLCPLTCQDPKSVNNSSCFSARNLTVGDHFCSRLDRYVSNVTELKRREPEAIAMFCDLDAILEKYDCAQPYSVHVEARQCQFCRVAFQDWVCAVVADGEDGSDDPWNGPVPSTCRSQTKEKPITTQSLLKCPRCASICLQVIRVCPYLAPDRYQVDDHGRVGLHVSQYGGHPAFYCPGHEDFEPSERPTLFSTSSCPGALENVKKLCGDSGDQSDSDDYHNNNHGSRSKSYDQFDSLLNSRQSSYVPRPPQSFPVVQDDRTIYYYNYNHLSKRKSPARSFRDLYSLLHSRPTDDTEDDDDDYEDYYGTYEDFNNNNNNNNNFDDEFSSNNDNNNNKYVYSYDENLADNLFLQNSDERREKESFTEPPVHFTSCCWEYSYSSIDTKEYSEDVMGRIVDEPYARLDQEIINYQCCKSDGECSVKDSLRNRNSRSSSSQNNNDNDDANKLRLKRRSTFTQTQVRSDTTVRREVRNSDLKKSSVSSGAKNGPKLRAGPVVLYVVPLLLLTLVSLLVQELWTLQVLCRLGGVLLVPPILGLVLLLCNLLLRLLILLFLLVVKLLLFKSLLFLWRSGGMQTVLWTRDTTNSVVNSTTTTTFLPNRVVLEPESLLLANYYYYSSWRRRRRRLLLSLCPGLGTQEKESLLEWSVVDYCRCSRGQFLVDDTCNYYYKYSFGGYILERNRNHYYYCSHYKYRVRDEVQNVDVPRVHTRRVCSGYSKYPWHLTCVSLLSLLPIIFSLKCYVLLLLLSSHIFTVRMGWFLNRIEFSSLRLLFHHRSSFFSPRSTLRCSKFSYFITLIFIRCSKGIAGGVNKHRVLVCKENLLCLTCTGDLLLFLLAFLILILLSLNASRVFPFKCCRKRYGASGVSCQFLRVKLSYIQSQCKKNGHIYNKHSCL